MIPILIGIGYLLALIITVSFLGIVWGVILEKYRWNDGVNRKTQTRWKLVDPSPYCDTDWIDRGFRTYINGSDELIIRFNGDRL